MEKLTKEDILAELTANDGICYVATNELDPEALAILVAEGKVEIGESVPGAEGETLLSFTAAYIAEILGE